MNMSPSHNQKEDLGSYFAFIRPDEDENLKSEQLELNDRKARIREALCIDTGPLGISFTPEVEVLTAAAAAETESSINRQDINDPYTIFKQLKFPHLRRPPYSPASGSELSSTASSPTFSQHDQYHYLEIQTNIQTVTIDSPPVNMEIASTSAITTSSPSVAERSPAASFLSNFMSPVARNNIEEYPSIVDNYTLYDTIGFGGFSTVRKAQNNKTQDIVAVKIINQNLMTELDFTRLNRELDIWKSLNHPNILTLKKVIKNRTNNHCYLVCEYCPDGSLLDYINQRLVMPFKNPLLEKTTKAIFREICEGVRYLHQDRKVCHKDLKLENILFDRRGKVKICDFGLAMHRQRRGHEIYEVAGGSLAYAAPEQIQHTRPLACPKTDIWSLGVILYALVVGRLPFNDAYELRLQQKILAGQYILPENLQVDLKKLIDGCLAYNPEQRFTIHQVLQASWFTTLDS